MIRRLSLAALVVCALFGIRLHAQGLPVVPGASGFGMSTRAAYACGPSPTVYRVTNLNDTGAGSLRDALENGVAGRVVIFETSGTIVLQSDITVRNGCLTVAGQTAPSPGITVRGNTNCSVSCGGISLMGASDVLIQHLRIRPGNGGPLLAPTAAHDALLVYINYPACPCSQNVVLDHVSLSWAGGKLLNLVPGPPANITVWRSIVAEALYYASNVTMDVGQVSSLGALIGGTSGGGNVSLYQNLFAENSDRNPEIHENTSTQFANNVVYNWGKDSVNNYQWAGLFYATGSGPWLANFVGNVYIAGPSPSPFTPLYTVGTYSGVSGSQIYLNDNLIDQTTQPVTDYINYLGFDPRVNTPPVSFSGYTPLASSTVKTSVLANAGARPLDRDAVDARVVTDVTNRTGAVIATQATVGGWPTLAANTRALTLPANPNTDSGNGYTNLEIWLQGYAAGVETRAPVTTAVHSGDDLQAVINAAYLGDTILIDAGTTFTGNYILPAKAGSLTLTIMSAGSLPGAGVRVLPANVAQLAKLQTNTTLPVLATQPNANHYALIGLELTVSPGTVTTYDLVTLGDGSSAQNSLSQVPDDLLIDRCYLHGEATNGTKRGVALNASHVTVKNSYLTDFKVKGQDSQALAGWNGPGPFTITNNYVAGAGENILFGGADTSIANLVPSNITITNNFVTKPLAWRGVWTVKNSLELKNALHVTVSGNVFENVWLDAQTGFCVLFTVRNQDGSNPWATVGDVTFSTNVVRHCGAGISVLGHDDTPNYVSVPLVGLTITNDLFYDISAATWAGPGMMLSISGGADQVAIRHNTWINDGQDTILAYGPTGPTTNFSLRDSILLDNLYGIAGDNVGLGNGAIATYFPGSTITTNAMVAFPSASNPTNNFYPATVGAVGFYGYSTSDYRLLSTSTYHNAASDGTDVGVNISQLSSEAGLPSGGVPSPPALTIACPNPVMASAGTASQLVVTYAPPATSGGTAPITAVCAPASGSAFPVGVTKVTCTATDNVAVTASCNFSITISATAPSVSCPADLIAPSTTGQPIPVTYPAAVTTGGVSPVSTTCSPASGSIFPVATTSVTCAAVDAQSQTGSCHFNLTVQNTAPPVPPPTPGTGPNLPTTPSPPDLGVGINATPTLQWKETTLDPTLVYTVYFSRNGSTPQVIGTGLTTPYLPLPRLKRHTTYQWNVLVTTASGPTQGPTWTFTTR